MQVLYIAILVRVVSFGFSPTWEVRRPRVVAALLMCMLISASRDRLSLMVDPRYVNWCMTLSW